MRILPRAWINTDVTQKRCPIVDPITFPMIGEGPVKMEDIKKFYLKILRKVHWQQIWTMHVQFS